LITQIAVFAVVYLTYRIVLVFGRRDNKDKTIEVREVSLLREATSPIACKVESTALKDKEVESKNDSSFLLEKLVDKIGFRKETMHKPETFKPGIHDADNWLRFDFERTAQVNNWSKRDKIQIVKLFLTDKVIDELITCDPIVRDDWDHFVNWFTNRYVDSSFKIKKSVEFQSTMQMEKESCCHYFEEKLKLGNISELQFSSNQIVILVFL